MLNVDQFLSGEAPDLDVKKSWGKAMGDPIPVHCEQFSGLCKSIHDGRERVGKNFDQFLFGFETEFERATNDTGAAVRSSLAGAGLGSMAEAIMGVAPERPPPNTQMKVMRVEPKPAEITSAVLHDEESTPKLDTSVLSSFGDISLVAHLLAKKSGKADAYSDLKIEVALGSFDKVAGQGIGWLNAAMETIAWLASEKGDTAKFKKEVLEAFPQLAGVGSRIVDMSAAKFSRVEEKDSVVKISWESPIDFQSASTHYPGVGEFLGLFNPLLITLKKPGEAVRMAELAIKDGAIHGSMYVRDGQMVWVGDYVDIVNWDDKECFVMDAEVECSLAPAGVTFASIPFPKMTLRSFFERKGILEVTCVETNETQFETVANLAFDMDQFRRLLKEEFRFELKQVPPVSASEEWTLRSLIHVAFPSSSAAKVIVQWFRDFICRQMARLDTFKAFCDLSAALGKDAATLSKA